MGIEAYVVQSTLALNVNPTLSGVRQVFEAFQQLQKQMQACVSLMGKMNSAAGGSAAFATSMGHARDAARETAAAMQSTADSVVRAAQASAAAQASSLARPPAMLALPAPVRDFTLQGNSYGPGRDLVPVGPGRQWEYARGTGYEGPLTAYSAPGGLGSRPFTTGGAGGAPGADEPFFPGGRPPVNLYNATGERPQHGDYYAAAYTAQAAGSAAGGLVDSSFDAAAGFQATQQALRQQGMSKDQVDQATAAAFKAQHDAMGTYVGHNLELIVKLMGLTQSAETSIAMLPEMARAQQVFAGFGRDGGREVFSAMQSAEMRGILFKKDAGGNEVADTGAIAGFLKNMEAITAMTGGRYGPGEVMQMLRSAGVAGNLMGDEHGFAEMMPLIQSIGAARAGTAMRAFSQQFSAGKMSEAGLGLLTDMGIIQHPELVRKLGMGQFMLKPGAMGFGDFEQANTNPIGFVLERLLPNVDTFLARTYGSHFTGADDKGKLALESQAMQQLASRIPGGVFDSEIVRLAPLIARDKRAFEAQQSGSRDAYNTVVAQNPLMRLEATKAALDAAKINLGVDNMQAYIAGLNAVTGGLNAMSAVFRANPMLGAGLMGVADALKIIGPTIGGLMMAVPGWMAYARIAKSLGSGGGMPGMPTAVASGGGMLRTALGLLAVPEIAGQVMSLVHAGGQKEADLFAGLGWKQMATQTAVQHGMNPDDAMQKYGTGNDSVLKYIFGKITEQQLAAEKAKHDAPTNVQVVVHNSIDGKDIPSSSMSATVKKASGPLTGTGNVDSRQTYTTTEH